MPAQRRCPRFLPSQTDRPGVHRPDAGPARRRDAAPSCVRGPDHRGSSSSTARRTPRCERRTPRPSGPRGRASSMRVHAEASRSPRRRCAPSVSFRSAVTSWRAPVCRSYRTFRPSRRAGSKAPSSAPGDGQRRGLRGARVRDADRLGRGRHAGAATDAQLRRRRPRPRGSHADRARADLPDSGSVQGSLGSCNLPVPRVLAGRAQPLAVVPETAAGVTKL